MIKRELTCIGCPMGCHLTTTLDDDGGFVGVEGYSCPIGRRYGEEEVTHPMRIVTSLMELEGRAAPLSVKTASPVPRALALECAAEIKKHKARPPVHIGDVMIKDILGTGVDVVATKNAE